MGKIDIMKTILIGGATSVAAYFLIKTVEAKKPKSTRFVQSINIDAINREILEGGVVSIKYNITPLPKSVIPKTIWGTVNVKSQPTIQATATNITVPPYEQKVILSETLHGEIDITFKEAGSYQVYLTVDNVDSNKIAILVRKSGIKPKSGIAIEVKEDRKGFPVEIYIDKDKHVVKKDGKYTFAVLPGKHTVTIDYIVNGKVMQKMRKDVDLKDGETVTIKYVIISTIPIPPHTPVTPLKTSKTQPYTSNNNIIK